MVQHLPRARSQVFLEISQAFCFLLDSWDHPNLRWQVPKNTTRSNISQEQEISLMLEIFQDFFGSILDFCIFEVMANWFLEVHDPTFSQSKNSRIYRYFSGCFGLLSILLGLCLHIMRTAHFKKFAESLRKRRFN